jgi:hypothetical protein
VHAQVRIIPRTFRYYPRYTQRICLSLVRKPFRLQELAQFKGSFDHQVPRHAVAGVEIEYQLIGAFLVTNSRRPGMQLAHTDFNESEQSH